eukprot:m.104897 g.104897  ORF g.104897 m.104897 type:complete len:523 (+) comp20977_c0_seq2:94-1662(+)
MHPVGWAFVLCSLGVLLPRGHTQGDASDGCDATPAAMLGQSPPHDEACDEPVAPVPTERSCAGGSSSSLLGTPQPRPQPQPQPQGATSGQWPRSRSSNHGPSGWTSPEVRRIPWSADALAAAVAVGEPVVFSHVPHLHTLQWSPGRLSRALPAVQRFRQPRDSPVFRYWSKGAALDAEPQFHREVDERIVPAAEFFSQMHSHASRVYASGPIVEVLSPELRRELGDSAEHFRINPTPNRDGGGVRNASTEPGQPRDAATLPDVRQGDAAEMVTSVWFGGAGVVAAMHYDTSFNVHATVHGTKRYTFAPPAAGVATGLFPSLHPHYRQVQPEARLALEGTGLTRRVEISAGDAVYIPPYWFHEVQSMSPEGTVSLSYWSESNTYWEMEKAFTLGIPFEEEWGDEGFRGAASAYLRLLADRLGQDGTLALTALARRWTLLLHRANANSKAANRVSCGEFPAARTAVLRPRMEELATLFDLIEPAERQIYYGNFAEHLVYRVLGTANGVGDFVVHCVCSGDGPVH